MKVSVLIVDDDPRKIEIISKELNELKQDIEIHIAVHAAEARRELSSRNFDLLILDVCLPTRAGVSELASPYVGLELLKQIVEDQDIPAPRQIVGVTADLNSIEGFSDKFRELTTQIFHVTPGVHDWKQSLRRLIGRIVNAHTDAYDVDLCVVTALREPELQQFLSLPINWKAEESLGNGILFRLGLVEINGLKRKVVAAHCAQMGLVASTFLTRIMIEKFKPRLLMMSGICGGIGNKVQLGDIIIAEKSWDWQSGKVLDDGTFENAPDPKEASSVLVSLALGVKDLLPQFHREFGGVRIPNPPNLLLGPLISGSSVVANSSMHEKFLGQHRKSLGVDMECFGVYYSAKSSPSPAPHVLCVKAVSDLANRAKSDDIQSYCSYMSARVIYEVAMRFFQT